MNNSEAIAIAFQHVSETKGLVESLIISSEQFDYRGAKQALSELQRKVRELGKVQGKLQQQLPPARNVVSLERLGR